MNGFLDITTVIFLVIAVVVFIRLRGVLGRRTGTERPPFDPYSRREKPAASEPNDNVVALPRSGVERGPVATATADVAARLKGVAEEGTPLAAALTAIANADPSFEPKAFIDGAKRAYEMVVTAYAEGDRKTLKMLLSREVYDGFVSAISGREQRGETMEFKFVGISKAEISDAAVKGGTAQITLRFLSNLVSATHDATGAVIDGDPGHVTDVTDVWTFSRELASRDPNWKLIATESVD